MQNIEFESPTLNEKGEIVARTQYKAAQFSEDLGDGIRLDMIVIPSGIFQMGSLTHHGNDEEKPRHLVSIKSFLLGNFLVTQGQWKAIMGRLPPCRFKGDQLPVERVSWNDADIFCQQLSRKTGGTYHLPSESQWEYACRAGSDAPFSFGETLTTDFANFCGEHIFRLEPAGVYRHVTTEGTKFPPNAFGIHDMHGNLWEWCADSWMDDYSSASRDDSAYQNHRDEHRVARGGSWHEPAANCRGAARVRFIGSEADDFIGFRVAGMSNSM